MDTNRIVKKILLNAPLGRVWRAIADSREFGTWFGTKLNEPFAPGARIIGVISSTAADAEVAKAQKQHEGKEIVFEIERMEPERLFSFRWHPHAVEPQVDYSTEATTLVEFELEQTAEGVLLTVTESGFDQIALERRAMALRANDEGWGMMVKVIEKYLAESS